MLAVLVVVVAIFSTLSPRFLTFSDFMAMLHSAVPTMIGAAGLSLLVIGGGIDLSIGSTLLFSAAVGMELVVNHKWPLGVGLVVILIVGVVLGLINAVIVNVFRVAPLVATIGTLFLYDGLALLLTGSQDIVTPPALRSFGYERIGPVFWDVVVGLVLLLAIHVLHTRTSFGRRATACADDQHSSIQLGMNPMQIVTILFIISAICAALSGIDNIAQNGAVSPTTGANLVFNGIAAIVLGGISLYGGSGKVFPGVAIGALTLALIRNGLSLAGASPYLYAVVEGLVIFVAMFGDTLRSRGTAGRAILSPKRTDDGTGLQAGARQH